MVLHLVPQNGLINAVFSAAAIFRRPAHADIAGGAKFAAESFGELRRPHSLFAEVSVLLPDVRRQFALEERAHLVAKCFFL
jgi:hypothetical protein